MKFRNLLTTLPLALVLVNASAEAPSNSKQISVFNFSTKVERTVERDVMQASLFSRKTGKSLPELKKNLSVNLNRVLEEVKKHPDIEVQTDGISNSVNYNNNNKIEGWTASGYIYLKSKNFDAMAKVLENLGNNVAINSIGFSVSPEKLASLENEMTLEIIKQFQAKAEVIQKGLGAKNYRLANVQLDTPNGQQYEFFNRAMPMSASLKSSSSYNEEMPLEAGKTTISATASGNVEFE